MVVLQRLNVSVVTILATLALCGPGAGTADAVTAATQKACQRPILTSHQGSLAEGDGNTIPAYLGAVQRGAEAIEMDLQRTKDAHFVMFHNAYVDGTTNGTGYVRDKTLTQIQRLRTTRSGDQIPTFGETLTSLKKYDVRFEVELKDPELWPRRTLPRLVQMVRDFHLADRVVFYSLDIPTVTRIHRRWPGLHDAWKSVFVNVRPKQAAKFTDAVVLNYRSLTRDKVRAVHAAGLKAFSARLEGPPGWKRAVYAGTDTVMTRAITGYLDWCALQTS